MFGRTAVGLLLVLFGFLFLADQLDVADFGGIIASWWPLVVVGIGVSRLVRASGRRLGPVVVTVVGVILLLGTLDLISSVWGLLWPLAIVGAGIWLIMHRDTTAHMNDAETVHLTATFGGMESVSRSPNFRGGSMTAFFGGVGLDLRQAGVGPGGAVLEVTTFCGGAEVTVPTTWRVVIEGTPLFGGFENSAVGGGTLEHNVPELTVKGTILFGGIEVTSKD